MRKNEQYRRNDGLGDGEVFVVCVYQIDGRHYYTELHAVSKAFVRSFVKNYIKSVRGIDPEVFIGATGRAARLQAQEWARRERVTLTPRPYDISVLHNLRTDEPTIKSCSQKGGGYYDAYEEVDW